MEKFKKDIKFMNVDYVFTNDNYITSTSTLGAELDKDVKTNGKNSKTHRNNTRVKTGLSGTKEGPQIKKQTEKGSFNS